jgi:molybdopterin-guanine dinucleotide biosynthesis protein A
MTSPPPVFGLILAGGMSRRMQQDKAALEIQGKQQLERAFELASGVCAKTFVSVRADQLNDPLRSRFPTIVDQKDGLGPIGGISSAQAAHPEAAWLILACDLPFLTAATLKFLLDHRDPSKPATAFISTHDGLPEPLCAVWEPSSREAVTAWIASGKTCPRKFLINSATHLLKQPDPQALDNVNTPEEYSAASALLGATGHRSPATAPDLGLPRLAATRSLLPEAQIKTLRIQYFALFREQAGRGEETLESTADTPAHLYAELQRRHPFKLQKEQLRVAVNAEFCDWQASLKSGDTVVFIPPVAGG